MTPAKVDWGTFMDSMWLVYKAEDRELGFAGGKGEEERNKMSVN